MHIRHAQRVSSRCHDNTIALAINHTRHNRRFQLSANDNMSHRRKSSGNRGVASEVAIAVATAVVVETTPPIAACVVVVVAAADMVVAMAATLSTTIATLIAVAAAHSL